MLCPVYFGRLGQNGCSAAAHQKVNGRPQDRVGGDAGIAVRPSALQTDFKMADRYRSARHLVGGGQHFLNKLYAFGDAFRRPAGILNIEGMQALVLDKVLRLHQSGYLVCFAAQPTDKDRKSVEQGKSMSVRVARGWPRIIK